MYFVTDLDAFNDRIAFSVPVFNDRFVISVFSDRFVIRLLKDRFFIYLAHSMTDLSLVY